MSPFAWFLLLGLICLICQGFFTMMEMAIVSFNRVRLQYYINEGDQKAIWLGKLLMRPTYLFGTTLIGVNFFLQLGSEISRMFYMSVGLSPDLAPISQIAIVVIFAELAPMFAARSHTEHTTRIGITLIYYLSKILVPFIWVIDVICRSIHYFLRTPPRNANYFTREELQKAIETKDNRNAPAEDKEIDTLIEAIFALKDKTPNEIMQPLENVLTIPYESTVLDVKREVKKKYIPYTLVHYGERENIFGILYTRDIFRLPDDAPIKEIVRSPWFLTEKNHLFPIFKQFRWNNQQLAVVLNDEGLATGVLSLDDLIDAIFQNMNHPKTSDNNKAKILVDRAFDAKTEVREINELLSISLPYKEWDTLEDLMDAHLGSFPRKGDTVKIGPFFLTKEEVPFMADSTIRITGGN